MLICPQCQFENPDTNKFCQGCGLSLTQKVCPECGTQVNLDTEKCQNCGTSTGTIWLAIVTKSGTAATEAVDSPLATLWQLLQQTPEQAVGRFLDPQQHYRILEVLPSVAALPEFQLRVLDCQPLQLSLLETVLHRSVSPTESGPKPSSPSPAEPVKLDITALPPLAQSYVALQSQFHQSLPKLREAWSEDDYQVLLLEDRSQFSRLAELWSQPTTSQFEVLHWLYGMTELWTALEPWCSRQSLLEINNLRVDEDGVLCLQRLYADPAAPPLSWQSLGLLWQELFDRTQRTQIGPLAILISGLSLGKLQAPGQVQAELEAIAQDWQDKQPLAKTPEPLPVGSLLSAGDEEPTIGFTQALSMASSSSQSPDPTASAPDPTAADPEPEDTTGDYEDTPTVVLPMQLFSLEDAGRTDTGQQRDHNEDCFGLQTDVLKVESPQGRLLQARGLYILCDGMGGHASGEVASSLAVETLKQYFKTHWFSEPMTETNRPQLPSEESIREGIILANQAIYDLNQQGDRSGSGRMGTTMVLVLLQGNHVAVAHVGDSRLYRLSRRQGLEQVTTDHDVGQREIQRGVEGAIAYARPDAYQLTQALGPRDDSFINPDVQFLDLSEDTLLLLCSDGLTDNDLLETHWRTHLEPLLSSQVNLERGVGQLIDLGNQYNGHDNITAVAIRLKVRPNLEAMKR